MCSRSLCTRAGSLKHLKHLAEGATKGAEAIDGKELLEGPASSGSCDFVQYDDMLAQRAAISALLFSNVDPIPIESQLNQSDAPSEPPPGESPIEMDALEMG